VVLDGEGILAEELNEHLVLDFIFGLAHLDHHVLLLALLGSGLRRGLGLHGALAALLLLLLDLVLNYLVVQAVLAEQGLVVRLVRLHPWLMASLLRLATDAQLVVHLGVLPRLRGVQVESLVYLVHDVRLRRMRLRQTFDFAVGSSAEEGRHC